MCVSAASANTGAAAAQQVRDARVTGAARSPVMMMHHHHPHHNQDTMLLILYSISWVFNIVIKKGLISKVKKGSFSARARKCNAVNVDH